MATLNPFTPAKRIVVKIGSALLVEQKTGELRQAWLEALCDELAILAAKKIDIIIVSSGAIALGRARLGLLGKSLSLAEKQACAATGQSLLTQAYERALARHKIITAQALLTLTDTEDRRRWLNARQAIETLLKLRAVPVINENDTVSTDEIRYGDNDRLAARTAQMMGADTLVLLSDIDGLYTDDPRSNPHARHIPVVEALTPDILAMAGSANESAKVGTGGMVTKLAAAQIAVQAGCYMCILDGSTLSPLTRLQKGERCTWFKAATKPRDARRQWIMGSLAPKGTLVIDQGAETALLKGKSLLAAGVTHISGEFSKGDAVIVVTGDGQTLAHGLISYGYDDAVRIKGLKSGQIAQTLGYTNGAALIHRDNLVVVTR